MSRRRKPNGVRSRDRSRPKYAGSGASAARAGLARHRPATIAPAIHDVHLIDDSRPRMDDRQAAGAPNVGREAESLNSAADAGVLILDGGLATELERRGHDVSGALWSAAILRSAPEAIEQVHYDYYAAGAN